MAHRACWRPDGARCSRVIAAVLMLTGVFASHGGGRVRAEEHLGARWRAARDEAVRGLHDLAAWCTKAKLFAARADVYEDVLLFDADDPKARKWLRYKRAKDGTWTRKKGYMPPANRGGGRPQFEERRREWEGAFADEVRAILTAADEVDDRHLASKVLQLAVQVLPSADDLHEANGEVRLDQGGETRWVLGESRTALERRRDLRASGKDAVDGVLEPPRGHLENIDRPGGVRWTSVHQGVHVRVVCTLAPEEAKKLYVNCEAAWPVFKSVFGLQAPLRDDKVRYGRGITAYAFPSLEAGNAFLSAQPGLTPRDLEFQKRVIGLWLPKRPALLVKADTEASRLETGPKLVFGMMCATQLGIGPQRGWASTGLLHYLVYLVTRTRIVGSAHDVHGRYGHPRGEAPETKESTPTTDDWLGAGLKLLRSDEKPSLWLMAGKDSNSLTQPEVLYAYCLVAYLIEGRPEECVDFFRDVGRAKEVNLEPIVMKHLGSRLPALEARLVRWLEETTEGGGAGGR